MDIVTLANEISNSAEYQDGAMTIGTLWWEALERAIHNVYPEFKPSHPDSGVMPCAHGCDYCKTFDVNSSL